jgi:hypothetical protein
LAKALQQQQAAQE